MPGGLCETPRNIEKYLEITEDGGRWERVRLIAETSLPGNRGAKILVWTTRELVCPHRPPVLAAATGYRRLSIFTHTGLL